MEAYADRINAIEITATRLSEKICDIENIKTDMRLTNNSMKEIKESMAGVNAFVKNIDTMLEFMKTEISQIKELPNEYIKNVEYKIDKMIDLKIFKYVFRGLLFGLPSTGGVIGIIWAAFKLISKHFS